MVLSFWPISHVSLCNHLNHGPLATFPSVTLPCVVDVVVVDHLVFFSSLVVLCASVMSFFANYSTVSP